MQSLILNLVLMDCILSHYCVVASTLAKSYLLNTVPTYVYIVVHACIVLLELYGPAAAACSVLNQMSTLCALPLLLYRLYPCDAFHLWVYGNQV